MNRQTEARNVQMRYYAYLVRFWQDNPNDGWRASAQSVQSGETVRFGDLEQLFAFLRTQTAPLLDSIPTSTPEGTQAKNGK